jgi:hypothetical protein
LAPSSAVVSFSAVVPSVWLTVTVFWMVAEVLVMLRNLTLR